MREDIKRRWIEALTNGEYTQTEGALHTDEGFCCLGVLCDLAEKEGVGRWSTYKGASGSYKFINDGEWARNALTDEVSAWAGVDSIDPRLFENPDGDDVTLSILNDSGVDFPTIAKLIEYHL